MGRIMSWAWPYVAFVVLAWLVGLWAAWWCALGAFGALLFALHEIGAAKAQGIAAGTDETPQAAQPVGQEPGPKDAPK